MACRDTGLAYFEINFQHASFIFLRYTTRSMSPLVAGGWAMAQAEPACLLYSST